MRSRNRWLLSTSLVTLVTIILTNPARSAGFALKEQSAEAQGTSYAGAGTRADDPSTLFYNPAGITRLPGYQISAGISAIIPNGTLASGTASTGSYLGGRQYQGVTGTNSGVNAGLPSAYATAQLTDSVFVGIGITAPFGLATKYPTNSVARYYALTTDLKTINIGPTVAYKVTPQISVALGMNIETADAHLSNAVDFGAIGALKGLAPYGFLPGTNTGIATVKGSDTALGWNAGALYEPVAGTRIGATYRSAIFHNLSGSLTYSGVPAPFAAAFPNSAATAKVPEPSTATLSFSQDLGKFTVMADATYTGWSVFQNLQAYTGPTLATATTEKFRDTVAVSLGADYRISDQWTVRGGTMYDPTPIQNNYRTPKIADSDRFWLSVGATWNATEHLALTGAYSHLFANDATVNLVDGGPGTVNFIKGNLVANYNVSVDIVSLQARYRF